MEASVGPFAIINCEPRQARKGATVAAKLCAGVRLAEAAASLHLKSFPIYSHHRYNCQSSIHIH